MATVWEQLNVNHASDQFVLAGYGNRLHDLTGQTYKRSLELVDCSWYTCWLVLFGTLILLFQGPIRANVVSLLGLQGCYTTVQFLCLRSCMLSFELSIRADIVAEIPAKCVCPDPENFQTPDSLRQTNYAHLVPAGRFPCWPFAGEGRLGLRCSETLLAEWCAATVQLNNAEDGKS